MPSLPGCISEGDTYNEAMKNIKESINLYLDPIEDNLIISKNTIVKEIFV